MKFKLCVVILLSCFHESVLHGAVMGTRGGGEELEYIYGARAFFSLLGSPTHLCVFDGLHESFCTHSARAITFVCAGHTLLFPPAFWPRPGGRDCAAC